MQVGGQVVEPLPALTWKEEVLVAEEEMLVALVEMLEVLVEKLLELAVEPWLLELVAQAARVQAPSAVQPKPRLEGQQAGTQVLQQSSAVLRCSKSLAGLDCRLFSECWSPDRGSHFSISSASGCRFVFLFLF